MIIEMLTIDHLVLTVSNIERTKEFYTKIFGKAEFTDEDSIMYIINNTKLFFVLPYNTEFIERGDRFNPSRVGLEHLAFGVSSLDELIKINQLLTDSSITHSGIHIDNHSNSEKIWLNDPDGIRVEFFLRK